ncbi:chemotaxis protein CheW [Rhodoligotrophos defluvii]|uniref:chemotaxis protein CheW n=1 Tax=Rhodoligotrophos defluvii TaxID=2561934 RepID=UPI0010C985B6|nr:chemotaxis protein CheW [Rhodoligotrophos defluvii]
MTSEDTPPEPGELRRRLRREIIGTLREAKSNAAARIERLLDERTRMLAARGDVLSRDAAFDSGGRKVLVCAVGGERVGLPIEAVATVLSHVTPVPVPSRVPEVVGTIASGAEIYNVLDLGRLLNTGAGERQREGMLVLLRRKAPAVALLVDRIEEAVSFAETAAMPGRQALQIRGIAEYLIDPRESDEGGIALLDVDALLAPLLSSTPTPQSGAA